MNVVIHEKTKLDKLMFYFFDVIYFFTDIFSKSIWHKCRLCKKRLHFYDSFDDITIHTCGVFYKTDKHHYKIYTKNNHIEKENIRITINNQQYEIVFDYHRGETILKTISYGIYQVISFKFLMQYSDEKDLKNKIQRYLSLM